jgi:hypothetical protein
MKNCGCGQLGGAHRVQDGSLTDMLVALMRCEE